MTRPTPFSRLGRPTVFGALLAVALAGAVGARLAVGAQTIDDAFITFRYSQHIAALDGFTYNPPERVLGTSTPLFALLMAVPARLDLSLPASAFVISLAADVLALALVAAILAGLGYRLAALLTTIALALAPSVVAYSVSGMETSLYVALGLTVFWSLQRERWDMAALAAGFAWFCRPDGVLVAAVVCIAAFRTLPWRRALRVGLLIAGIVLPWLAFASAYFGSPVPTSMLAKADIATDPLAGFRVVKGVFFTAPQLLPSVLAAVGAALLWRTRSLSVRAWLVWGGIYATVFTAGRAFSHYFWYFTPLMPIYFSGIAVGIETSLRALTRISQPSLQRAVRAAGPTLAIAGFALVGAWWLGQQVTRIEHSQSVRESLYRVVAERLAASGEACPLAATEIGVLGYYYPGPIVDLFGLVTPEAIGRPRADVLRRSTACWLVTYDDHLTALAPTVFEEPWFEREFILVERVRVSATRALTVYERANRSAGVLNKGSGGPWPRPGARLIARGR